MKDRENRSRALNMQKIRKIHRKTAKVQSALQRFGDEYGEKRSKNFLIFITRTNPTLFWALKSKRRLLSWSHNYKEWKRKILPLSSLEFVISYRKSSAILNSYNTLSSVHSMIRQFIIFSLVLNEEVNLVVYISPIGTQRSRHL